MGLLKNNIVRRAFNQSLVEYTLKMLKTQIL